MSIQDRRRILGPVEAKPLVFATTKGPSAPGTPGTSKLPEYTNPTIRTGLMKNCNGSCSIETDDISILSSVYGPKPTRSNQFQSRCSLNINIKSSVFSTTELKELSNFLIDILESYVCLELYPKAGIDIFVNFNIENVRDLSWYIPYIVMSITMGLVDADVDVTDMVSGGYADGYAICFGKNGDEIVGVWKDTGDVLDDDGFDKAVKACREQYFEARSLMVNYLTGNFKKMKV